MGYFDKHEARNVDMPAQIAQAVIDVMGAVGKLTKGNRNNHGGYNYVGIDDFRTAVNPCCSAAGLIIKSVCVGAERFITRGKDKDRHMVRYKFKARLIHSSGATWTDEEDYREVEVDAVGAQSMGIATSYFWKEYTKDLLQIPTGEKDADAQEHLETETRRAAVKTAKAERESGEEHISWDVGDGLKPVPIAKLQDECRAHMATIDKGQALLDWFERNKAPRAQLYASNKPLAMAIKKDFEQRLAAVAPPTHKKAVGKNHHDDAEALL